MTGGLRDRYDDRISGVLSCYDRVVITGTLPTVCYAAGMTRFLAVPPWNTFQRTLFDSQVARNHERGTPLGVGDDAALEECDQEEVTMKVSEVMTRDVRVANPNETIQEAAQVMKGFDIGVLPVGQENRLVGMI